MTKLKSFGNKRGERDQIEGDCCSIRLLQGGGVIEIRTRGGTKNQVSPSASTPYSVLTTCVPA